MGFAPKSEEGRFVSFWSAEPGFGLYEQQRTATTCDATLKLLHGSGFELEAIDLPVVGAAVEST